MYEDASCGQSICHPEMIWFTPRMNLTDCGQSGVLKLSAVDPPLVTSHQWAQRL